MRKIVDLSNEWLFKTDSENVGIEDEWFHQKLTGGKFVNVPHIWQREGGELVTYSGTAWYQKDILSLQISPNKNWHICFEAVDYQCDLWWNGFYLGFHEGGFTPFDFKINQEWMKERNQLTVRVYDFPDNAEIPIGKQGSWYTRVSGIWQSVYLEERPAAFIDNVFVTSDIDSKKIEISVRTAENQEVEKIYYLIRTHSIGEKEWNVDEEKLSGTFPSGRMKAVIDMPAMKLWSPEEPCLYEIEITISACGVNDQFTTVFGCRKVEYADGKILLNHTPVYIRGALDQAFYPETIYTAPSVNFIKEEIFLAKQMGFNLLRKHIKVELPEYLYWADRMGMLIWAEPPNYVKWTKIAIARFVKGLKEMVERDYNHPSIIIWSIYNEEWGLEWDLEFDEEKQKHVEELFTKLKELDSSRLICDNSGWTHIKTDINDHHRYFVAPEQIDSWKQDLDEYVIGQPDKNFVKRNHTGNEPIIISELGVWGLPDIEKLKEFYNGKEPWWFVNQGEATHQDDYKKPVTLFENFHSFGISESFKNTSELAKRSQKRMVRAVKSIIEEIRKRPSISGYVVTEFTDIEWETNGWLNFLRKPKEDFEKLVQFNGANFILADLPKHNYQSGEKTAFDLFIVLSNPDSMDYSIKWTIQSESSILEKGEKKIQIEGQSFLHLTKAIEWIVPKVQGAVPGILKIELWKDGSKVTANDAELTFSNPDVLILGSERKVYIQHPSEEMQQILATSGITITDSIDDADVVLSSQLDREMIRYVRNGGRLIFLAEEGDRIPEKGEYTFRQLDLGESWPRASSMNYVNKEWLPNLPVHSEMGWEFEGLFPDYVIPFTDYKKVGKKRTVNMFGNPSLAASAEVISGYFQGWLGQNGGSVLLQKSGKGYILIITWKIASQIKNNPMALFILHHFIEQLVKRSNQSVPLKF